MKNLLKLGFGSAALIAASGMTITESAESYTTLGHKLGTSQRDIRVHNNFDDSASNNNTTEHANWPGYTGADLAMWKAAAEWNSDSFGDGTGDGTQGNVGDGGANFSAIWNGSASGFTTGQNIVHAPNISGGGAIAWMFGGSNGWSIEFIDNDFNFADGPDGINGSQMDIQGVGCHEYGHSLGLGHSNTNGATMYYATSNGVTGTRSIHSDDKAGVQAVYGVQDAAMPYISSISGSLSGGGTAVVVGGNFTATACRLWFNSDVLDGGSGGGEVYKLNNLTSTGGGTQISFTVPNSGIEAGGVHVKLDGGGESLSEGHPFDYGGGSGGGSNTIVLNGPTSFNAGQKVTYSFANARPSVYYELNYSLSNAGHSIGGHNFDLGLPQTTVKSGTTTASGTAIISKRIPNSAAGLTVYIEALTLDGGVYEDSNMIQLDIM
jgi:hypothetical protein